MKSILVFLFVFSTQAVLAESPVVTGVGAYCEGRAFSGNVYTVELCHEDVPFDANQVYAEGELVPCPGTQAVVTKTSPSGKMETAKVSIGTGSYYMGTDDTTEMYVTDYNGNLEGVDLELNGYSVLHINTHGDSAPSSMTLTVQEKGWKASFANASCWFVMQ